jgi:hypothetical protein
VCPIALILRLHTLWGPLIACLTDIDQLAPEGEARALLAAADSTEDLRLSLSPLTQQQQKKKKKKNGLLTAGRQPGADVSAAQPGSGLISEGVDTCYGSKIPKTDIPTPVGWYPRTPFRDNRTFTAVQVSIGWVGIQAVRPVSEEHCNVCGEVFIKCGCPYRIATWCCSPQHQGHMYLQHCWVTLVLPSYPSCCQVSPYGANLAIVLYRHNKADGSS